MANYKLTAEADRDIEGIWDYTNRNWGKNQAIKYLGQLEKQLIALAQRPGLGKQRHELTGSPMSCRCGRHVIFYRKGKKRIEILRVLHDSMDFPRHL